MFVASRAGPPADQLPPHCATKRKLPREGAPKLAASSFYCRRRRRRLRKHWDLCGLGTRKSAPVKSAAAQAIQQAAATAPSNTTHLTKAA